MKEKHAGSPARPPSRGHDQTALWGSAVFKSVPSNKKRPPGDPPSSSAVHTLPLNHAARRKSRAPPCFPGPAHRAAPHHTSGGVQNTCDLTSGILRQLRAQAGSKPGVRALGVAQRPRGHALAPGGGPEAPLMWPFPNSRAWQKRFFFRLRLSVFYRKNPERRIMTSFLMTLLS